MASIWWIFSINPKYSVGAWTKFPENLKASSIEPTVHVAGLARRVKRFGCWHSCLRNPQFDTKRGRCEDGASCKCIVDLLGKVHGVACEMRGRHPLASDRPQRSAVPAKIPLSELKMLECNYKTCWTMEKGTRGGKEDLIRRVVRVLEGIFNKGKCYCLRQRPINPSDAQPAALNHVHINENYKFAQSYRTFPTQDGLCVCRFGWQKVPNSRPWKDNQAGREDWSFEREARGVGPNQVKIFENDDTRDVIQCGLSGCRHVVLKVPRAEGVNFTNGNPPWYELEAERRKFQPAHPHEQATPVVCNLRNCWKVREDSDLPLDGPSASDDPARESIQLNSKDRRLLLGPQKALSSKTEQGPLRCTHKECNWVRRDEADGLRSEGPAGRENGAQVGVGVDDVVPDQDGLCPCHKAYLTYYNWKHRK